METFEARQQDLHQLTWIDSSLTTSPRTSAGTSVKLFWGKISNFLSPCVNPRPIRFTRENETEVEGVKGTRFVLNATDTFGLFFIFSLFCGHLVGKNQLLLIIGNASTNPDNWCYNANLPYGVHNSTGCKGGDTTLKWVRMISVDISLNLYFMFGISFKNFVNHWWVFPQTHLRTFVSLPHFLDADPSFREQFTKESMKPDRARCERTEIVPWKC